MGVTTSINAETGIIVTGDDSIGVGNLNYAGDSIAINEGSITSGDGVVGVRHRRLRTNPTIACSRRRDCCR